MLLIACCNTVYVSKYVFLYSEIIVANAVARDFKLYAFTRMSSNKYAMLLRVLLAIHKVCFVCQCSLY